MRRQDTTAFRIDSEFWYKNTFGPNIVSLEAERRYVSTDWNHHLREGTS